MTPLQNQTNDRCIRRLQLLICIPSSTIPVQVLLHIIVHTRSQRVPNSIVQVQDRLRILNLCTFQCWNIRSTNHFQEVLQVIRRSSKPKLQTQYIEPGVLSFITWQILQNLWQCPHKLQHAVGKASRLRLLSLEELEKGALRLPKL
ncbi:hypothetical protein V8G54_018555 [Vigna mungo]|uniref:Uncharacterized protein n=1 Tax=Vigna mungo TaxID=3915 RepID=A0AAQ3RUQ2_VIGMU